MTISNTQSIENDLWDFYVICTKPQQWNFIKINIVWRISSSFWNSWQSYPILNTKFSYDRLEDLNTSITLWLSHWRYMYCLMNILIDKVYWSKIYLLIVHCNYVGLSLVMSVISISGIVLVLSGNRFLLGTETVGSLLIKWVLARLLFWYFNPKHFS